MFGGREALALVTWRRPSMKFTTSWQGLLEPGSWAVSMVAIAVSGGLMISMAGGAF
ncbi:MAG: hypothetical protein LBS77_03045 [Desulfovibrio sp.]|nr:hypothetical protein [Desulfovibrio sp.]